MKCRKQFFIIVLALVAASVFAGVAAAQVPVCFALCPTNAQPGDLVTMTAFDENGEMIDLSTVEIFESNIWGAALPDAEDDRFHSLVFVQGDELFINIEIIDATCEEDWSYHSAAPSASPPTRERRSACPRWTSARPRHGAAAHAWPRRSAGRPHST